MFCRLDDELFVVMLELCMILPLYFLGFIFIFTINYPAVPLPSTESRLHKEVISYYFIVIIVIKMNKNGCGCNSLINFEGANNI